MENSENAKSVAIPPEKPVASVTAVKPLDLANVRALCQDKLNLKLDKWQEQLILEENKNVCIRAGRQVGKSLGVALKALFYALKYDKRTVLIVAASQRQSSLLFEKVTEFAKILAPEMITEEPTLTKMLLKNGSKIYSLPVGKTGYSIRGFAIDLLICDEAAFIPENVWTALTPMLATTNGKLILLSTPFGKGGFYYNCFGDSAYRSFHLNSEECPRIPKEFLKSEKERMSRIQYAQEYLGEFVEEFNCYFPTALIKSCCKLLEWKTEEMKNEFAYFLGCDIARYGGDENAFVIVEYQNEHCIRVVKILTTTRVSLTDTIGRIFDLDKKFNFKKIYIDDNGIGAGVTDVLIEQLGRRVEGINNSSKTIDKEAKRRLKILKEDLYSNLLVLMESGKIEMINLPELKRSLMSIQFEHSTDKVLKIYGNYSHIAEALVRACWCNKAKGLNIFIS
jgi:hypothetical protein